MFSSLQEREPYFLKASENEVGPGAYNSEKHSGSPEVNPKTLYSTIDKTKSGGKDKKISKASSSSVFKSKSRRIPISYNFNPGPGYYTEAGGVVSSNIIPDEGDSKYYQVVENGIRFTKVQPYASDKVDRFNYTNIPEIGMTKKAVQKREDLDERTLEIKYKKNIAKFSKNYNNFRISEEK